MSEPWIPRKVIRNFLTKRACEKALEPFVAKVNRKIFTIAVEKIKLSIFSIIKTLFF